MAKRRASKPAVTFRLSQDVYDYLVERAKSKESTVEFMLANWVEAQARKNMP
jgi:hypothetical protein